MKVYSGEIDMGKRWSKLQARLYNLMEPAVNFQIHCTLKEKEENI